MPEKSTFLCVYDYGMGGVWVTIDASSAHEIEQRFPDLRVMRDRPEWMTDDVYEAIRQEFAFDIDSPTGWLATFIYDKQRESEGKWPFLFRGVKNGRTELRTIWARKESEITSQYSGLESMLGVGIPGDDLANAGYSDIDEPDDFLERYRN